VTPDESEYAWAHFDLGYGADGQWRYAIGDHLSKNAFANKVDAYRYATRPQRLTDDGQLIPDIRWSPELN
jgi:hypothetical protein